MSRYPDTEGAILRSILRMPETQENARDYEHYRQRLWALERQGAA